MSTSTIPAAIDGLVTILAASADLRTVTIFDGAPTTNTPKDFIAVAFVEDGEAVSSRQSPKGMGNLRREETFDITCTISAWNGGTVAKTVRDRAFAIFAACEDAIRAGGTLSGSVIFAQIAQVGVAQYQTEQGAVCDITFTVSAEARI